MSPPPPADAPSRLKIALVVGFYMVAALVMVFVNKAVLNSSPNLPLLMLLIQFLIAVICLHLSALITSKIEIPRRMLSWEKMKQLTPILITNVVGLTFNTLCLRGVDASFFQIARGLVLPFTIAVSALDAKASPGTPVLVAGITVTFGFFFGIIPTKVSATSTVSASEQATALIWGAASSLMTAVHAVLIKRSLPYVDNSAIQLAYWTNASAALILLPFVLFDGEAASVWTSLQGPGDIPAVWDWKTFVAGCLITGIVGFLLCVAGLLSIKITSPVTHMFSSACRSVLQTVLGVWIFHDVLTTNRVSSIFVILAGSMYYTWIKSKAIDAKPNQQQRSRDTEVEEGLLMSERERILSEEDDNSSMTVFEIAESDEEDAKEKSVRV